MVRIEGFEHGARRGSTCVLTAKGVKFTEWLLLEGHT